MATTTIVNTTPSSIILVDETAPGGRRILLARSQTVVGEDAWARFVETHDTLPALVGGHLFAKAAA